MLKLVKLIDQNLFFILPPFLAFKNHGYPAM